MSSFRNVNFKYLHMIASRTRSALTMLTMAVALAGCQGKDEVHVYTIPKQATSTVAASPRQAPPRSVEQRMLAAIVEGPDRVWFFKMLEPTEQVEPASAGFRTLLASLRFNDQAEPTWTLPKGWTETPSTGMRLATLHAGEPGNAPTVSVIGLAPPQDVLENVNRWRQQLQLTALNGEQLDESLETVEAGDLKIYVADLTGQVDPADPMVSPFASAAGMPNPHAGTAESPSVTASAPVPQPPFDREAPAAWQQIEATGMRKAAYQVRDEPHSAEVTVITLSPAAGDLLDNVNRWRGELGLAPINAEDLQGHTRAISIDELAGHWMNTIQSDAEPAKATVAAMAADGRQVWFFKLTGDAVLVKQEVDNFERFVDSIRFAK